MADEFVTAVDRGKRPLLEGLDGEDFVEVLDLDLLPGFEGDRVGQHRHGLALGKLLREIDRVLRDLRHPVDPHLFGLTIVHEYTAG